MAIMGLLDRFLLPKTVKSVDDIRNIHLSDSFRLNIQILKFLGLWPPEQGSKWYVPYAVYTTFVFFFIHILWHLSVFAECYINVNSLEQLGPLYFCVGTIMAVIKGLCTLSNRNKIGQIVKNLDREIFVAKTLKQYEIVASVVRFSQLMFLIYMVACCCTIIMMLIYPLFIFNTRKLPFVGWFPWDWTKTPFYELSYFYQIVGIAFIGTIDIVTPTGVALMSNICAQLDLLCYKLENMYDETEDRLKKSFGLGVVSPQDVYDAMYEALGECVEHHRTILMLAADVDCVLNYTVFYEFMFVALCSCMAMFQLTMLDPSSVQFYSVLLAQTTLYFELAMYCFMGNEVMLKSRNLLRAAFNISWVYCSVHFRKNLLFFMLGLSRPMRLRAGNYFTISIDTWTLIIKSSWSYFAVLRQVQNR